MKTIIVNGKEMYSGSLGNMVFFHLNGENYCRRKPEFCRNPNTVKQAKHRNHFKACFMFARLVWDRKIKSAWDQKAIEMSGHNLFMKTNFHCFNETGQIEDYENLKISVGNLPLPENIVVANNLAGNGSIVITWDENCWYGDAAPTDRLAVVALKGNDPVVMTGLSFIRRSGQANLQLPYVTCDTVHVYVFFYSESGVSFSESYYSPLTIS